jgi:hypothetical protein
MAYCRLHVEAVTYSTVRLSALGLGCVKTRCRAKPIEWILHQIAIDVGEILKRGRF